MRLGSNVVAKLGFAPSFGWEVIWAPAGVAAALTAANLGLAYLEWVQYGYFSPYVAAAAIVSARICVRAGVCAALWSVALWNFLVVPPAFEFNPPSVAEITAYIAAFVAAVFSAPRRARVIEEAPLNRDKPLPFVRERKPDSNGKTEASCWDVVSSGDWGEDNIVGNQYGRILLDRIQGNVYGTPPLSMVLKDMVENGEYTGVEAGFANAIERAVVTADEPPMTVNVGALLAEYYAQNAGFEARVRE